MREIKFRAWDKKEKRWAYEIPFTVLTVTNDKALFKLESNTVEWVQYTGLKDKNGKDIYEGDIVKITYDLEEEIHEIIYCDEHDYPAFDLKDWTGESNGISEAVCSSDIDIEIIGNIYENPELLKEE